MNDNNGTLGDEVAAELRGEDLAETIRQAEAEAGLELAARMDRVHIDAWVRDWQARSRTS